MKKVNQIKIVWVFLGILIVAFVSSISFADFYVIGGSKKARKTILVSPESTETASGTALLNAMSSITDASSTNSYLILIEPGIYDIGTTSLEMQEYVDIKGSGENVTTIRGSMDESFNGVINGADNAEMRFLKVKHSGAGPGSYAVGFYNYEASPIITHVTIDISGASYVRGILNRSNASPKISDVTITVSGETATYGIHNESASDTIINNVRITASGGSSNFGVFNNTAHPEIANCHILATGGSDNDYGIFSQNNSGVILKIDRCFIRGADNAIYTSGTGETTFIGSSRLSGNPVSGSGAHRCVGVYNNSFELLNDDCSDP